MYNIYILFSFIFHQSYPNNTFLQIIFPSYASWTCTNAHSFDVGKCTTVMELCQHEHLFRFSKLLTDAHLQYYVEVRAAKFTTN